MVDRLRATAAAFTPLSTRSDIIRPLNGQEHNGITHYNSIPASAVFPVSDTRQQPQHQDQNRLPVLQIHCAELSQLLILENKKHQDEIAALREQLRQLEEETAEEKLTRLCVKSETKIVKLKSEVENMNAEDELLKAENEELTKTLKRLEVEIKKAQPATEFTVREAKRGKRM
ncbi:unnamed protein product [Alternaria alternata]